MRPSIFLTVFFLSICTAIVSVAPGASAAAGGISVTDAWIRYLPADLPAAGYFTLRNGTGAPITLEGAQSDAFAHVMMHRTVQEGATSTMQHVDRLTLAAGETVVFAPGGYHLMLMEAKAHIAPADRVTLVLQFADGFRLPVSFLVKPATGQ
jgi:copper(I)-binding protein